MYAIGTWLFLHELPHQCSIEAISLELWKVTLVGGHVIVSKTVTNCIGTVGRCKVVLEKKRKLVIP